MEKKKLQSVSIAALIVSILPLAALAPSLLHFSLSAGIRTAWAGANTVFVLLGLTLSVVCVRSKESRSIINIASFESLNDVVQTITGIVVKETIPDTVLTQADEVEVIDISFESLKERLERGEIYNLNTVSQALKNFFRKGNLSALREIALRQIAQEVDNNLNEYMNNKNIKTNWHTTERVLVSISSSPKASKVIRYGARIAQRYRCEFYVICVEEKSLLSKGYSLEDWKIIEKHEELARNLGAETIRLQGKNIVKEILKFSEEKRITQIVLGHSKRNKLTTFFKGSIINKIIEHSKGTEIRIIPWDL